MVARARQGRQPAGGGDPAPAETAPAPASAPAQAAGKPVAPLQVAARSIEPWRGRGLTEDDKIRQVLILRAKAYQRPTCEADDKTLYVMAATKYAEVLMRSAGCSQFPKCAMGTGAFERVWQLNRSAADQPVAAAMAAVHAAGGLSEKDFRGDVGRAVRVIAATDFSSGPPPECESSRSRTGTWRVRIRRR